MFHAMQDALLALSEGAKVFILYLTAAANAHCKASGRQTMSEDDVYAALSEIQFPEFVAPLQASARGEPHNLQPAWTVSTCCCSLPTGARSGVCRPGVECAERRPANGAGQSMCFSSAPATMRRSVLLCMLPS